MKAAIQVCGVFSLLLFASGAVEADEAKHAADDARLRELIEQVRRAEERYRNLETVLRVISQDDPNPAAPNGRKNLSESDETRYALRQGELFLFKRREVETKSPHDPVVKEQVAAFDGETTRSVNFGNCVNIFAGRHEPSQFHPPHTWGMRPLWVNFPLSVYLEGTEAIKKHSKSFKSPTQRGRVFEIARVEVAYAGDEIVDGLKCAKLLSRHWCRESDGPEAAQIWLATERNFLCVKMVASQGEGDQLYFRNEARATDLTEIAPGLWLPKRIEITHARRSLNGGKPQVWRRQTLTLDRANANPKYPRSHFHINVPPDLPAYKINAEGFLEGSAMNSVNAPAGDPRELARVIAELKRQEERWQRYDVSTAMSYRALEARSMPGATITMEEVERTISLPGKLYCDRVVKSHGSVTFGSAGPVAAPPPDEMRDTLSRSEGSWDGQWIRTSQWFADKGELPADPRSTGLQKGGPKGLSAFRPHTAIFSDDRMGRRSLSDFLSAEYWDERNKYRYLLEYLGEETVNDLRCDLLRLGAMFGNQMSPAHQYFFIWLAKDRDYLPVRSEHVDLAWSDRLPTGVAYVDDLREVAPGIWMPYHVVETSHDNWGRDGTGSGQILLGWRRERRVESLNLEPDVSDDLFAPAVNAGTWVDVSNESGYIIGRVRAKQNGPLKVDDAKFSVMNESARVDQRDSGDRKRREAALNALLGTSAPALASGTWLNSPPLAKETLAGKVLLLDFWAEWWRPCEHDLQTLAKVQRNLAADGVTVIAVHAAGSDAADIQSFADEVKLDGPIFIDRANESGQSRWGALFEQLGVRELPLAFVVDRQGKIAAFGPLDKMIPRARTLAAEN